MSAHYCKSAGLARHCESCAYNRAHWPKDHPQRREVKARIRADKRCGTWQPRGPK